VVEHRAGRYAFHDLLRVYAAEQAHADTTDEQRDLAVRRIIDHYLHTARAAALVRHPHRCLAELDPALPGVTVEAFTERAEIVTWFGTERPVLLATVELATRAGHDTLAWELADVLTTFLGVQGHWYDVATIQATALAQAIRLADRLRQAHSHRNLGNARLRVGCVPDAQLHLRRALELYEELGDIAGQGAVHTSFASLRSEQGQFPDALRHANQALTLWRAIDHRTGQAEALNNLGWFQARSGNHDQALDNCTRALALYEELGDPDGSAATLDSIAYVYNRLGRHTDSLGYYKQALTHLRESHRQYGEAETLTSIGDVYHDIGDAASAREAWEHALDILHQLRLPDIASIRDRLDRLSLVTE